MDCCTLSCQIVAAVIIIAGVLVIIKKIFR